MAKWVPDSYLDLILDSIMVADEEAVCSALPATYFEAIWPGVWVPSTAYTVGDTAHAPTQNGFVYECITGGTSGAGEPGWGVAQDQEFTDGGVTWKTHTNVSLANEPLIPSDFTKTNGDVDGRKLTIAQKMSVVTHTAGTVTHTALIEHATQTIHLVTEAVTTIAGDNDVLAGRTTIFFAFDINVRDPQ